MFKAIKGYEGIYEINELGQVRSVDRTVKFKDGRVFNYKGKELKPGMDKDGYATVRLSKNGVTKTHKVHRLVAGEFLSNPDNLPQIHHKNHNRADNRVCNLQWASAAEQIDNHWRAAMSKVRNCTKLRIVGHGIDRIYDSAHEVERELGIPNNNALLVAKGKFKQAKGYKIYFA